MRFLITGGSGLIGQELVGNLIADGHEVIVLSRSPERVTHLPSKARVEGWDGCTAAGWGALVNEVEAVINLAGESLAAGRWTASRKRAILESRVNAGKAVVEAVSAAAQKPRVVVQASGVGYYAPRGKEELIETSPAGSGFVAQVCLAWEASTAPVQTLGVRHVVARLGVALSSLGGALPNLLPPFRFFFGGPLGSGEQWFPWIHIEDVVRVLRLFSERESVSGVYNVCAPNPVTQGEFSRALGRVMRRPSWLPVPGFALRLALGEMADMLLVSQRQIPRNLMRSQFRFLYPTALDALKDLVV